MTKVANSLCHASHYASGPVEQQRQHSKLLVYHFHVSTWISIIDMATLLVSEKTNFRVTSESLFNNLLGKIVDNQVRLEALNLINQHKDKWPKLYHEQRQQLDIDQVAREDSTRVDHSYEKLKNSVVTSQLPAAIPPQLYTVQDYLQR